MKIIIAFFLTALIFIGCSSKETADTQVTPKLVVDKSLASLKLNDQHEKAHTLKATTSKVIFAFSKDAAHTCNDFFVTKKATYLEDNNVAFVADVSAAPSLIRSMFIMPGLKDFKHRVLILDDKAVASAYKANQNIEKIVVVEIKDGIIKNIKSLNSADELAKEIEN
ncbi:MAG: hypothetical protein U9P72_02995 [Campylobacterota bacterium]|nr:hypothetical protein [Campylobacterota bacterium]